MSSLTRRPNGRWRARYRDPRTGRETARHFRTRADAQRWLDHTTTDHLTGHWVDPRAGALTLAEYYTAYAARQLWQPTTRRAMDHAVTTSPLAAMPLNRIVPADVEAWVKDMVDDGLAPTTVQARFSAVRTVLNAAVRDRLIATNPATGVRLPRLTSRLRRGVLPGPAEVDGLIAVADPRLAVAVDLAASAGLRHGELRGLQVWDLDLTAAVVHVRRQVRSTTGGGWEAVPPKYGSHRTVPLPGPTVTRLRAYLTSTGLRFTPTAWLLEGAGNAPVQPTTLSRSWARAKHAAGVDPGLRLHDLRHYYASKLIAEGVDIIRVRDALGHASATTTLSVYAHLWSAPGAAPSPVGA